MPSAMPGGRGSKPSSIFVWSSLFSMKPSPLSSTMPKRPSISVLTRSRMSAISSRFIVLCVQNLIINFLDGMSKEQQIAKFFEIADSNADGKISKDELVGFFNKMLDQLEAQLA